MCEIIIKHVRDYVTELDILLEPLEVIDVGLFLIAVGTLILYLVYLHNKRKKIERLNNLGIEDYNKMYEQYVSLVYLTAQKKCYETISLNQNWIEIFHNYIYDIWECVEREFENVDDFNIATCLMYALTRDNTSDINIVFAFECAKKLISKPKVYNTQYIDPGEEIKLKMLYQLPEINISDELNSEVIMSIIKVYLSRELPEEMLQLSDFLHILYLKCK